MVGHGSGSQVAHHHAEAVTEWHRNAQAIGGREPEPLGHEVAVVQDVVVAERGALGVPGGARGELDFEWRRRTTVLARDIFANSEMKRRICDRHHIIPQSRCY